MSRNIRKLLRQRLIVCVGSGGVGKTTTAAALALAGALADRDTAVITVDPARRLKDSLGLSGLELHPNRVPLVETDAILDALALDTKRTFDDLIARVAPSPEIAARIFENPLYQEFSNGLGGSVEYMAMERLLDLLSLDTYDLVVVDTPPSAHAKDLLSAPLRITDFLASRALKFLKSPASVLGLDGSRMTRMALSAIFAALQRWTGMNLLRDLSDFATSFEQMTEGFRTRAEALERDLRCETTSFVLVTTPEPDTVDAAIEFHRELARERFHLAGIIANRVHFFPELAPGCADAYPEPLRRKLLANYADFQTLSDRDARALARLRHETGAPLLATLPALEEPPASFAGLRRFADLLGASAGGK